jgi:hypothetical protein
MPGQLLPGIGIDWVPARPIRVPNDRGLYSFEAHVGRSITQVSRTNDGDFSASDAESFEKWSQALASSADLIKQACMACETAHGKEFATAIIPCLVVPNDTLWVVDYNQSGQRLCAPKSEEHATLYIGRLYEGPNRFSYTITHLHILTRAGARAFFGRVGNDPSLWDTLFPTTLFPNVAQ